jgi:hypothetical protein
MNKSPNKPRCKCRVSDGLSWPHYRQCKRTVWRDGYCSVHHPGAISLRRAAREAKWGKVREQNELRQVAEDIGHLVLSDLATAKRNFKLTPTRQILHTWLKLRSKP